MSVHIILRLSVMCLTALIGWVVGRLVADWAVVAQIPISRGYYPFIITFLGAAIGFGIAPYVTLTPYRALRYRMGQWSARTMMMGIVGALMGLIMAALLTIPLAMLPGMWGHITPVVATVVLSSFGAMLMVVRDKDILNIVGLFMARDGLRGKRQMVVLDTSVIIDGRVADIRRSGFISGALIIPRFVLDELQHIADSPDVLRRNRGRRGLDILNKMQKDDRIPLEIWERDVPDIREVDGKLIKLAQELECPVLTNDYNLNRVAELQGVQVLNINELANAVKAVVLPGETLRVQIIQEGKESGQGVGYLDDGTMVVVEDGRRHINETIEVMVTRVLQTVAGRMIFGQLPDNRR